MNGDEDNDDDGDGDGEDDDSHCCYHFHCCSVDSCHHCHGRSNAR